MRSQKKSRLVLPEGRLRRFQLSDLAVDEPLRLTTTRWPRVLSLAVLWAVFTVVCFHVADYRFDAIGLLSRSAPAAEHPSPPAALAQLTEPQPRPLSQGLAPGSSRREKTPSEGRGPESGDAMGQVVPPPPQKPKPAPPSHQGSAFRAFSVPSPGMVSERRDGHEVRALGESEERSPLASFGLAAELTPMVDNLTRSSSRAIAGMSCERAFRRYGRSSAPPSSGSYASTAPLAAVLENRARYRHCRFPQDLSISICVTVRRGAAKGVTVVTEPYNLFVAGCVADVAKRARYPRLKGINLVRTELHVH